MTSVLVTILEEATVFEGADTVYRYDLVPPVLQEEWALAALVEQVQALCEEDRQRAEVHAGEQYAEIAAVVRQALFDAGLVGQPGQEKGENAETIAKSKIIQSASGSKEYGDPLDTLRPSQERPRHRREEGTRAAVWWKAAGHRITWFHVAIVGVVLAVVGLSWWTMGENSPLEVTATEADGGDENGSGAVSPTRPPDSLEASVEDKARSTVIHEVDRVRLSTPEGFRAEYVEGTVLLTGEDADLRIRVSADPIFSVPPEEVLREVMATVERDPTLHDIEPHELPQGEGVKMRYREDPGDGSQVQWSTWVESGHHMSVGCHTRGAATVAQRASCRIVEESVGLL